MNVMLENVDKEFLKTLKALCAQNKAIILTQEDELMTRENLKAYKKAKKELENGETLSHDEVKKRLGL